jgi:hypothetical protein
VDHPYTVSGLTDISGGTLVTYNSDFVIDNLPPVVVSTNPADNGDVTSGNPFTFDVFFSEPMNTSATTSSSFNLHGNFRNADYSAASFSWSPDGTELSITYASLPDDNYTMTLFSGGFQDLVGYFLNGVGDGTGSDFTSSFNFDIETAQAFPTPLNAVPPLGGLVYDPTLTGVIAPAGDLDSYTISVNAGETITVLMQSGALKGHIDLYDPSSTLIGSADASAAGQDTVLQAVHTTTTGTYTIVFSDTTGTAGLYTAQVTLNAALESEAHGGGSNNSIGTAQDISGSFLDLGTGGASRGAVVGQADGLPGSGTYSATAIDFTFTDISKSGTSLGLHGTDDAFAEITPADLGTFQFTLYGQTYNDLFVSSNGLITFGSGNSEFSNADMTSDPSQAAIAPLWDDYVLYLGANAEVYYKVTGSGSDQHLTIEWRQIDFFGSGGVSNITFEAILNEADGSIQFNYSNLDNGDFRSNGSQATVGIKDAGTQGPNRLLLAFNNGPNDFVGSLQSTLITFTPPPPQTFDYYSFHLDAGQSATVVINELQNAPGLSMELDDGSGTTLATGTAGPTNVSLAIENFVASTAGTYYVKVGGSNVTYNLVVTRGADFDLEHNDDPAHAQDISHTGGSLGAIFAPGGAQQGTSFEGIDFQHQPCSCLPPDNGLGVGDGYVVAAENASQIRISDMAGNILLDENMDTFFGLGEGNGGDPFVTYDDIANRWYVEQLDASYQGVELAVSRTANPLDGFMTSFINLGGLLDFPKIGFNADSVVITGDEFFDGSNVGIINFNKSTLLTGDFSFNLYTIAGYPTNWGLMPAKMHGSSPGDPMYFVDEAGWANGSHIRVWSATGLNSGSPTFTSTDIAVDPYGFPVSADQPGGHGSVATNFAWLISADWRNGELVTAHNATIPDDGFTTTHAIWYEVNTNTMTLTDQGVINSGPGVHSYMPAVAINDAGDIGITYMQSSDSEFISMYETIHRHDGDPGSVATPIDARAGESTMVYSFRTGDYSSIAVDPADGTTFWASSEYSPANSGSNIWATFISSFTAPPANESDWYSLTANDLEQIVLTTSTPSDQGGEFHNTLDPHIELYASDGTTLLATGTVLGDGRNEQIDYTVPSGTGGTFYVRVGSDNGTTGEYFLQKTVIPANGTVSGIVFNDKNDNHVFDAGDVGLGGVQIYVDGVYATTTDSSGNYSVTESAGPHTVSEVIPSAYIATSPATGSASVSVTGGVTTSQDFADALPASTLDNGQPGYSEVGSPPWTTENDGWHGTSRVHVDTGKTTVSATWGLVGQKGHPLNGGFEVFVTYQANADRGMVRYSLYDGDLNHPIGQVTLDQRVTPADGTYQGLTWASLGRVSLTRGKLIVVMTFAVRDTTRNMEADGVLVIPAASGHVAQSLGTASSSGLIAEPAAMSIGSPTLSTGSGLVSTGTSSLSSGSAGTSAAALINPQVGGVAVNIGGQSQSTTQSHGIVPTGIRTAARSNVAPHSGVDALFSQVRSATSSEDTHEDVADVLTRALGLDKLI